MTPENIFAAVFVLGIILALYFLPALVAREHQHRQFGAIFVLNLLLGWTLLGWVGALVWACTKPAVAIIVTPEGV